MPPPAHSVGQEDQHEEDLEPNRRHGKEIEGNEFRQVGLEEGPPGGRGRLARAHAIRLDRGFRHGNPQLFQFPENTWGPPLQIGRGELPNQRTGFLADRRPT